MNILEEEPLPNEEYGTEMSFVMAEDEAFVLSKFVLLLYPSINLSLKQHIFYSRLSKA